MASNPLDETTRKHLEAHHRDFEEFAQAMVDSHAGRFDDVFWSFVETHAPAHPQRIVDLGTGPGLLLPELAHRYPRTEIWGVEAQPAMVRRAEEEVLRCGHSIRLVRHDLTQRGIPGIEKGTIGLAIASMVLHEIQAPTLLMDETRQLLAPGGVWVIYDWIRHPLESYMDGRRPETVDEFTHFSEHCRYTAEDWNWMLEQSGYQIEEAMVRHSGRHVLIAASRKG